MAYDITSNRGLTGFPQGYVSAWQNFNPNQQQQPGRLTGRAAVQANAAENAAYAQRGQGNDIMSMIAQMFGGGTSGGKGSGATYAPPSHRGGRLAPWQSGQGVGYSGMSPTGGGGTAPQTGIPPATTNPQTPLAGNPLAGLAEQAPGVTSGQLSNDAIQQALGRLTGAGTGAFSGGMFGNLMSQNTSRQGNELQRAGAQQQSDMQQAFEVARANAGLQQMQLGSDINREHVTNSVLQRNNMLDMIRGLLGVI